MLSYPVRLISTEQKTVRAVFPDLPEAEAEADTEDAALVRAKFVLEVALARRLHADVTLPTPSDICGAPIVSTDRLVMKPAVETPANI